MTEHYIWDFSVLVSGIVLGAFISLGIQRYLKKNDTNSIIENMKNAIKKEIQQNIASLGKENIETTEEAQKTESELLLLETPAYESSVKSGNFILLSETLRVNISDLYTTINYINYLLEKLIDSQFTLTVKETKPQFAKIRIAQLKIFKEKHELVLEKLKIVLNQL